ncbi:hypothetical protein [Pseudoalteromonas sp. T1lg75]|uniref:hypothetical protein n=1 Tax=Pseudoalteromonas sp. T1lg75 TaxID=2077102 RepID=UPI000CF64AA5|nr:hypothetical protein [Pseudoalteromonas sp. T1lg75]
MKATFLTLLLICACFNTYASEAHEGIIKYSEKDIKELKINSVKSLISNHFDTKNIDIKSIEKVIFLANGFEKEMSEKEKDASVISAEVVEVLVKGNVLLINCTSSDLI